MTEHTEQPATPEPGYVCFTDIARLAVELGYTPHLTRSGVRRMADRDPAWPVPRDQWMRFGRTWILPWAPIKEYLRTREWKGRGPAKDKEADA